MKIITKFKDFYDKLKCYANMCSDDFLYIRKRQNILDTTIVKYTKGYYTIFNRTSSNSELFRCRVTAGLLGFCGNIHIIYKVERDSSYDNSYADLGYFYDKNAFLVALQRDKELLKVKNKRNGFTIYDGLFDYVHTKKLTLTEAKAKIIDSKHESTKRDLEKLIRIVNKENFFAKYNTPVFYITPGIVQKNVILNPCLEDLQFYKVMDGMQTYGQIEQFLGNELLPKDDPNQITDDLILAGNHGYDKWSFRQKGPKNKKRKLKKRK